MGKEDEGREEGAETPGMRQARATISLLSSVEQTILAGLAWGESARSLGRALQMHIATIEQHRRNVMEKLNARSTAEAVRVALCAGLDEWPPPRMPRRED